MFNGSIAFLNLPTLVVCIAILELDQMDLFKDQIGS